MRINIHYIYHMYKYMHIYIIVSLNSIFWGLSCLYTRAMSNLCPVPMSILHYLYCFIYINITDYIGNLFFSYLGIICIHHVCYSDCYYPIMHPIHVFTHEHAFRLIFCWVWHMGSHTLRLWRSKSRPSTWQLFSWSEIQR